MFNKREKVNWRGPATVLGINGQQVFVKHGGNSISVHLTEVRSIHCPMFYNDDDVNFLRDTPSTISDATNFKHDEVDKDLSNESDGEADSDEDFVPENTNHQPQKSEVEISTDFAPLVPQSNTERCLKRGDVVKMSEKSSEERECVILGRAGKASGRHKFWFNVEYVKPANLTGKQESIDFSKVYSDTVEINTVFMTATEDVLEKARTEEYKKLSFWDVFEEKQDIGQRKVKS